MQSPSRKVTFNLKQTCKSGGLSCILGTILKIGKYSLSRDDARDEKVSRILGTSRGLSQKIKVISLSKKKCVYAKLKIKPDFF